MKILHGLAACTALAAAGCAPAPAPPAVNPEPARMLRIHGTAETSLTLQVSTRFVTTAKHCRRTQGGTSVPQSTWVESPVTRSADSYEAVVALDHFREDQCGWHPFMIAFQVTNEAGLTTGHFESGPAGTALAPGPEGKVWISTPDQQDAPGGPRQGTTYIRPLDLKCDVSTLRGASKLSCVPNSPRELPLLSMAATEVQVDFEDFTNP